MSHFTSLKAGRPAGRASGAPQSAGVPAVRRKPVPGRRQAPGFTLVETAIAGAVLAALTAGMLTTMRYAQMISMGKAAGEQLSNLNEGVGRYMALYGSQIVAKDARCSDLDLELGTPGSQPMEPTAQPDCSMELELDVGGSKLRKTVQNVYQPTVQELFELGLVHSGSDVPLLPTTEGVVVSKYKQPVGNGQTLPTPRARMAVQIRLETTTSPAAAGAGSAANGTAQPSAGLLRTAYAAPAGLAIPNAAAAATAASGVSSSSFDMPPTLFGVNCYNGTKVKADGDAYYTGRPIFYDPADPTKILPIYTDAAIQQALRQGKVHAASGQAYCRYMQGKGYGLIVGGGSTIPGTPGTPGDDTGTPGTPGTGSATGKVLRSVVFNTQPYYYTPEGHTPPMGAVAQIGAALESAGYAGRLSMIRINNETGTDLRSLRGLSSTANPLKSRDGSQSVPGVLAAVNEALIGAPAQTDAGTGDDTGSGDFSWDAGGNSLTNAALIQGVQVAGGSAVIGTGNGLPTGGRDAVLSVNGNLVMGANSALIASGVEAEKLESAEVSAKTLNVTGSALRLGHGTKSSGFTLYMRNDASVRLPRVKPGDTCPTNSDLGVSSAVLIRHINTFQEAARLRFLLNCVPKPAPGQPMGRGESYWSSAEYQAMRTKYPESSYDWIYFDGSGADVPEHQASL